MGDRKPFVKLSKMAFGGKPRQGKGSKGKGKRKVLSPFRSKAIEKGRKGVKRKFNGKKERKPFSELSEERKEEIRARHEEKHAEQGREIVGDTFFFGQVAQRGKRYGWIKPSKFGKLPEEVQTKVTKMVKTKKAAAKKAGSTNDVFNQNVLFVHMSDVSEGVKIDTGDKVKFKVYVDSEGAGAYEVVTA